MKEGVWGIGLIIISLITFAVVGTMSNITTTNQQDYEFMKSSVEAAMYDARDEVKYRRGICVCTKKKGNPIKLTDVKDYEVLDPNEESECDGIVDGKKEYEEGQCRYLHGEYVINPDIFVESLISRFGTVAKNQETYDITVQDVIEYPPKTSVDVVYYQYLFEAMGETTQPINNRMDAIFEAKTIEPTVPAGTADVLVQRRNCKDEVENNTALTIKNISSGKVINTTSKTKVKNLAVGSYILSDGTNNTTFTVDPNDSGKTLVVYVRSTDLNNCPCLESDIPTTVSFE